MKFNESKSLYSMYRIVATGLALAVVLGITIYILYLFFEKTTLSSWHPTFMTLGFVLLMSEAILILSPDNIIVFLFPSLKDSSKLQHLVLQGLGLICILVGFITKIVDKNTNGYAHFTSDHAIIGLVAVICTFITYVGGIVTYNSVKLKNLVKPSYNKIGHTVAGILTFALGIVAVGTGIYNGTGLSNSDVQVACTVLVALASIVVLEGALKSAYSRIQRIL